MYCLGRGGRETSEPVVQGGNLSSPTAVMQETLPEHARCLSSCGCWAPRSSEPAPALGLLMVCGETRGLPGSGLCLGESAPGLAPLSTGSSRTCPAPAPSHLDSCVSLTCYMQSNRSHPGLTAFHCLSHRHSGLSCQLPQLECCRGLCWSPCCCPCPLGTSSLQPGRQDDPAKS